MIRGKALKKKQPKIDVNYSGGESRYGDYAVDYMLADVSDVSESVDELYAEVQIDEPFLNADDEVASYDELKQAILEQARLAGVPATMLRFWFDDRKARATGFLHR